MSDDRRLLGERVHRARLARGWSKERAAREAEISSITWKRVEDGLGVQDVKRYAVLAVLGLDGQGQPQQPQSRLDAALAELDASNLSSQAKAYIAQRIRESAESDDRTEDTPTGS